MHGGAWGPRPCQIDYCEAPAWRWCRVCGRRACGWHRVGGGWWWRCIECSQEELVELRRFHRELDLAAAVAASLAEQLRCGWCQRDYVPLRRGVWRPACRCEQISLRARFAGI